MIRKYSSSVYPPVPVLDVSLSAPMKDDWSGPYEAIVDSGADFTICPLDLFELIQPPVVKPVILSSQWKEKRSVHLYEVDLRIGDIIFPAVDVAGDPGSEEIILGRNVLNRVDLRLEEPALRTHLL